MCDKSVERGGRGEEGRTGNGFLWMCCLASAHGGRGGVSRCGFGALLA